MEKRNFKDLLAQFHDYWNPRVAAELNGQAVKLVKLKGEFVWHSHAHEDEMFYVVEGGFRMELKDRFIDLGPGDFLVIPRGVEHRPVAEEECSVVLFEPCSTVNTGDAESILTRNELDRI